MNNNNNNNNNKRNTKDGQQHRSQERAMELTLVQSLLKETALLMPWFGTFESQSWEAINLCDD
jgi:hypothetical protein